jgi:hypothetical protein
MCRVLNKKNTKVKNNEITESFQPKSVINLQIMKKRTKSVCNSPSIDDGWIKKTFLTAIYFNKKEGTKNHVFSRFFTPNLFFLGHLGRDLGVLVRCSRRFHGLSNFFTFFHVFSRLCVALHLVKKRTTVKLQSLFIDEKVWPNKNLSLSSLWRWATDSA